jgi:hypothetical protein
LRAHRAHERLNRTLVWQASFQTNTQRTGDVYAEFHGAAAASSPELCHDKCVPYVIAAYSSYVPRSSPAANDAQCRCVGITSTSLTLAGATVATLCRRAWCAIRSESPP